MLAKSRVRVQPQNSDTSYASFDYIQVEFRAFAQKTASEIEQASRIELEQQLKQGQKLLEAKEVLTRRKEYTRFREALNLTPAEGRKRMKLAEIFGDWDIERLLQISGCASLFTLCQSKYASVVESLRSVPEIAKELVKRLMKEARTVHTEQKPKPQEQYQQSDAVLSKHVDEETGNCYYTLKEVNLSDHVGSALAAKLETQTIGQVLAKASVVGDDYVTNQLQELESVIADVQRLSSENRELKFQLEKRDIRIAELESQLLSCCPLQKNNDVQTESMQFSTWKEVATAMMRDRAKLLKTVNFVNLGNTGFFTRQMASSCPYTAGANSQQPPKAESPSCYRAG